MDRVIFHCDLNSFYASVELLSHPELRHLPVAVCGDPASRHGIILAKNEPAKAFQVKTAETIWQAKRKCPDLALLPAHHGLYRDFSRKVNSLYQEYTDLVEPFGIDESWLDVTGTLHLFGGDGAALADRLRDEVRSRFGLTISIGVSFNKVFAKLGSDYKKPDATTVITRENFRELLWPLPVTDLLYVGRAAAQTFQRFGIRTIGGLAAFDREQLFQLLGKNGAQLHDFASGEDRSPVAPAGQYTPPKSIGNGYTFPDDLQGREEIRAGIAQLADQVAARLRRHGMKCQGISLSIRDPNFQDISRQTRLDRRPQRHCRGGGDGGPPLPARRRAGSGMQFFRGAVRHLGERLGGRDSVLHRLLRRWAQSGPNRPVRRHDGHRPLGGAGLAFRHPHQ